MASNPRTVLIMRKLQKRANVILALFVLSFALYLLFTIKTVFLEDYKYNFEFLRLVYKWNWQYWRFDLLFNILIMLLCGILLVFKNNCFVIGYLLNGMMCFYLYHVVFNLSLISLLLFILCFWFFYNHYAKHIINQSDKRIPIMHLGVFLINVTIICISEHFSSESHDIIVNLFFQPAPL